MSDLQLTIKLTVFYDGQFWVGVFERIERGTLMASRIVFGAEPSDEELLEFVCKRAHRIRFSRPVECKLQKASVNPKRRQREAARELAQRGASTKSQAALSAQREESALERKADVRQRRAEEAEARFAQRQEKKKAKHRGH